jgi:pSer/pThr/pTyr-binding forkhead associated (FHA) protein
VGSLKQIDDGRSITLGSRCLFGRHAACDVRIDNPRVSTEHASVHWVGDRWELRDLGSRNGTFVDGRKLGATERAVLAAGTTFSLGGEDSFLLEDASPPVASARHGKTGLRRNAAEGLLVLPDDDHPEVSIFEDAAGHWVAEEGDETRLVADRGIVIADGEGWVLDLPNTAGATWEVGALLPTLETLSLSFGVSRDEEFIEVTVVHEGGRTPLPARSHHYLLLTLARAALSDEAASAAERGWVDRELLCRMLATDPRKLNVDVFRVRKQLAALGIHGAAGIIARRPGTGQLRLGTHRVEVTKL